MPSVAGWGPGGDGSGRLLTKDHYVVNALTVVPVKADTAALSDMAEPPASDGPVLVETLAVGVCAAAESTAIASATATTAAIP